jgi:hypothetical protein
MESLSVIKTETINNGVKLGPPPVLMYVFSSKIFLFSAVKKPYFVSTFPHLRTIFAVKRHENAVSSVKVLAGHVSFINLKSQISPNQKIC